MEKQAINFVSPPASIFSAFDLNYYGPIDGHDVHELVAVLENLKAFDCPMVLHVSTKKGKGYRPAELDPTLYHGVSPFDPAVGIVPSGKKSSPTYTQIFGRWICDAAERDPKVYAITPAMREGSGLVEFEKRFPERYRDVAIAEQHAVTYGAGLACEGMKPVVAIYSTFLQRAMDQLIHDVALQNLPVAFAVDRGGLVGADGATHHGTFDLAMLRAVPNMIVMAPSDENECRLMLNTALEAKQPAAVRYPRGRGPGVEVTADAETIPVGVSRTLRAGEKIAVPRLRLDDERAGARRGKLERHPHRHAVREARRREGGFGSRAHAAHRPARCSVRRAPQFHHHDCGRRHYRAVLAPHRMGGWPCGNVGNLGYRHAHGSAQEYRDAQRAPRRN